MSDAVEVASGLVALSEGALWAPAARTLVLADLHVGFEAFHQARGQGVPEVEARHLRALLARLVARHAPDRVVVAGDVKHGFRRTLGGERRALRGVLAALDGPEVVLVEGNHDEGLAAATDRDVVPTFAFEAGGSRIVIAHGHAPVPRPTGSWLVVGHEHPRVRLAPGLDARAFLVDAASRHVVLPAASPWAAGVVPGRRYAGAALAGADPRAAALVALAEGEAWELGPLAELPRR